MSGGASGLIGYIYQQRYVAFRVLASIAMERIDGYDVSQKITDFGIESRASPEGKIWDVRLKLAKGKIQLRECKDTAITLTDRRTFYLRVRKELAAGTAAQDMSVGWVVDAGKQNSDILRHFTEMKDLARNGKLSLPTACSTRVSSARDALDEAVYYLAHTAATDKSNPCTLADARMVLAELTLDEWRMNDLGQSVQLLAANVFASGTGQVILNYIEGTLTEQIVREGAADYTTEGFIAALKTGQIVLALPTILSDLLRNHSAAGFSLEIPLLKWARLHGAPTKEWPLQERLPELQPLESCVVVASVGVGKSVSSQQAFREQSINRDPRHVLRFAAELLDTSQVKAISQLACILCGIAPAWVCIDGLDEIDRDRRGAWQQTINSLLAVPNLTIVITAREEVIAAYQWLQKLTDLLRQHRLQKLSVEQVQDAFRAEGLPVPSNLSLLKALQTTFLFALYAKVVTPGDMPLSDSGEVTAFQVIETFWKRAVVAESTGQRLVGDEGRSQQAKREALAYLVQRTISGTVPIPRDAIGDRASDGLEMLVREGVLLTQGSHAVNWIHDWLQEYAIIDWIAGKTSTPTSAALVTAFGEIETDHVARKAATAGLKWTVAHQEWGTPQDYLVELWTRHRRLAREVLALLIEGSTSLLSLAELPFELLLEAIEQAIVMRASQWEVQIAGLPIEMFTGQDGVRLNDAASRYDLGVCRA